MTIRGKSINLFLMDGTPTGRIKVTFANWTGVAYKVSRNDLDKCKDIPLLKQSGVYFLFGTDEAGKDLVYVGQAGIRKNGEAILLRLKEHVQNQEKDYWNEAVAFATTNNSFGPTEISYLENRFYNIAKEAGRYIVQNDKDPTPGHVTEEKQSELEEFIDYTRIVIGTLGYKVFEPLIRIGPASSTAEAEYLQEERMFFIKRSGADAKCKLTNEGLVVLAGSLIRKDLVPSCPEYAKAVREQNKEFIDGNSVLQRDVLFKTPSGASSFVLGAPTNGNVEWKTVEGKTLKEIEIAESEAL